MKVRAREVSETRQESAWKWKRAGRSHSVNTDEQTSIQILRELLQANYTKHTFRFRQSSEVDSLIKYWRDGVGGGGGVNLRIMEMGGGELKRNGVVTC